MLAGTISWLGGCALWATSVEYCRRRFFELFYKTHIIGPCHLLHVWLHAPCQPLGLHHARSVSCLCTPYSLL